MEVEVQGRVRQGHLRCTGADWKKKEKKQDPPDGDPSSLQGFLLMGKRGTGEK